MPLEGTGPAGSPARPLTGLLVSHRRQPGAEGPDPTPAPRGLPGAARTLLCIGLFTELVK